MSEYTKVYILYLFLLPLYLVKFNWKYAIQFCNKQLDSNIIHYFYTSTKSWRGYIFTAVCLCVCVSVCPIFLWTKFQPNGCIDLDAVFAKWFLITLAQTLLNLVTLGQRSRSRWPKMCVKMKRFLPSCTLGYKLNLTSKFHPDWTLFVNLLEIF